MSGYDAWKCRDVSLESGDEDLDEQLLAEIEAENAEIEAADAAELAAEARRPALAKVALTATGEERAA